VLAATGPRGGGTYVQGGPFDIAALPNAHEDDAERYLRIFSLTESSRRRGMDYVSRLQDRTGDRDLPVGHQAQTAQYDALVDWCIPEPCKLARLAGVRQPAMVTSGDNDTIIPTENAHLLGAHLPDVRVRIFDDAGHGFVFQWPVEFAQLVQDFLARA
jgi:pimeloyl-ACP methyl ester carboxylesterase